ncbi:hypothetical protein BDZ89DRAFT_1083014 [Hymenopellis radicata]|nr:hypothetical protein BDZ89DRAFT_1083014 [Hymenopellis radicata]
MPPMDHQFDALTMFTIYVWAVTASLKIALIFCRGSRSAAAPSTNERFSLTY